MTDRTIPPNSHPRSAFTFRAKRIVRHSDPVTIGKHQWRLTLYEHPHYGLLTGYEWRRADGAGFRTKGRTYRGDTWYLDEDWPSYNHNNGETAGMPKALRNLWDANPWAHRVNWPQTLSEPVESRRYQVQPTML